VASLPTTVIVGAGRLARVLASLLNDRGVVVRVATRRTVPDLAIPTGPPDDPATFRGARWILLATADDAIWDTAAQLGALGVVGKRTTVLHLSGARDRSVLKPLRLTGAALGAFHPLQSVAIPAVGAARLPGSFAGIDGDRRAIAAGRRLARVLGMVPVFIPEGAKAAYHAAATFVSTYIAVLYDLAVRLAIDAGIETKAARAMFLPLLAGTVANLELLPPARALTGAVRRGDVATIQSHLDILRDSDRTLYQELGKRALAMVKDFVPDPARVGVMERLLSRKTR